MIYLAYIALIFFTLRFLVTMINLLFSPVLKKRNPEGRPLVSVLIPVRNEEKNIVNLLNDLKNQSYDNIEVIVFNDESTDLTGQRVQNFTKKDTRFERIDSSGLPGGWLGKNNACHQMALGASGDYFLFLDADVRISSGLIESTLAEMQRFQLKLLTLFPKQLMKSSAEKISVPVMNTILLTLLPLILTRVSRHPSLAAANGQFMLFEKSVYRKLRPHEKTKSKPVEDILIARLYKKEGEKIACMTGNETIRCRMYHSLSEAKKGFTKNVAEYFFGSHILAVLYWFAGTFGLFFIAFFLPLIYFFISLMIIIVMKIAVSLMSHQPVWQNLTFAPLQQLFLGVIVISSYWYKKKKKLQWKGRNIY